MEYHYTLQKKELCPSAMSDFWNLYNFARDQMALQAGGRLQRLASDRGILLILGEDGKNWSLPISEVTHRAWDQGEANAPKRDLLW